ncbi:hypothetical protein ACEN2T_17850 [Pseudomonas sp. W22_MBD1_FP4]|uniref:hypothetical protein n=1 Tax=Pseudomonas sp. W22_MBD1_FP4 TaxID=3240272 RepID=UPI003F9E4EFC
MELNETLKVLACVRQGGARETYPEYDAIYHRMQKLCFTVAKVLMTMPLGTLADLGDREFLGIAPYKGKLEVVALQGYDDACEGDDVFWNFLGPVPYSDTDMGGEDQIDELSETIEKWLASPVFHQMAPANKLELLVQKAEAWAVAYDTERAAKGYNRPS